MMDLAVIRVYLVIWGCLTFAVRTVYVRRAGRRKAQAGTSYHTPHLLLVGSMALWIVLMIAFVIAPEMVLYKRLLIYSPVPSALLISGLGGLTASLWLYIRAHQALGEFYSIALFIKEDHRVIDVGPYAYIRHPMYTTYLLWLVSTVLFLPHYGMLLILFMALIGVYRMAKGEETMLCVALGNPYEVYLKRTGMFLPKWR